MQTDRQWEAWGRIDPYFAVLTSDEYRGTLSNEARAAFFKSGEEQISHVLRTIRKHLDPDFSPRSALDFGCGVGRTAIPLARICQTTGMDVSSAMLSEARLNAATAGIALDLCQSSTAQYDLIHSQIVFQHIPVKRGLAIAKQLLSQINAGGVAVLHFTYRNTKQPHIRALNWLRYRIPLLHSATNLIRGRAFNEPPTQMNSYPLEDLLQLFIGRPVYWERTNHGGYLGIVAYIKF